MSDGKEVHLGTKAGECDVCETPMSEVDHPITVEYTGTVLTFCSEKCYNEYLEDPDKFGLFEDEEEYE